MEFLAGLNGPIIPDPEMTITEDSFQKAQLALDFFRGNIDRIEYFKQRVDALGRSGQDTVITLINVDDPFGEILADILMPGHDWQKYRDAGELPVARGLAAKDGILEFLVDSGYEIAAQELAGADDLKVLVLHAESALVLHLDLNSG